MNIPDGLTEKELGLMRYEAAGLHRGWHLVSLPSPLMSRLLGRKCPGANWQYTANSETDEVTCGGVVWKTGGKAVCAMCFAVATIESLAHLDYVLELMWRLHWNKQFALGHVLRRDSGEKSWRNGKQLSEIERARMLAECETRYAKLPELAES